MNHNSYKYLIVLFFCLPFFNNSYLSAIGQQTEKDEKSDTIEVCNSPELITFIFKIDSYLIETKDWYKYIVTRIEIDNFKNHKLFQIINDTTDFMYGGDWVKYVDLNFDGFLDLDLPIGYHNLTQEHKFWIYDKNKKQYCFSPELSKLKTYSINKEKKEIETHSQSTGGKGYSSQRYKFLNGKLKLIESEYLNDYDFEREEIVNGILRTVESVEEDGDKVLIDRDTVSVFALKYYKFKFDSLLLTEKDWFYGNKDKDSVNTRNADLYNCDALGNYCIKYLRKEIYSYKLDKDSSLIKETKKYKVINNKWELVEDFNQ